MSQIKRVLTASAAILILQSCYYLQPVREPIEAVYYPVVSEDEPAAKDLLIMLPGIGEYAETFQRNELVNDLRSRELPLDAVAVNAHLGYYSARTLLARLKDDIVEPAFAKGYERIHFAGMSLGGYGALLYMREYPKDVSTAILLAPYLGTPDHYSYLSNIGGEAEKPEAEENIWPWLETLSEEDFSKIYLGYGDTDKYAEGHRLLSRFLPVEHTIAIAGDHSWPTWKRLWPQLISVMHQSGAAAAAAGSEQ